MREELVPGGTILTFSPELADKVGVNEAIFLHQLHYWTKKSENVRDGYTWVYNTYEDWVKQFPFWSRSTIVRIISKLEKESYVISGNYNKLKIDKTKWYRIDYSKIEQCMSHPSAHFEQTIVSSCADEHTNMSRAIPEITTEITTNNKEEEEEEAALSIVNFYNNNIDKVTDYIKDELLKRSKEYTPAILMLALEHTAKVSGLTRKLDYVDTLLNDWKDAGCHTVDEVREYIERKKLLEKKHAATNKQGKQSATFDAIERAKQRAKKPEYYMDNKTATEIAIMESDWLKKERTPEEIQKSNELADLLLNSCDRAERKHGVPDEDRIAEILRDIEDSGDSLVIVGGDEHEA